MNSGILQEWISEIPLKMQTVLVLGTRGPDTHRAPELKALVRWLRGNVFLPADPDNPDFMLAGDPPPIIEKSPIARELEFVTQHYYAHIMHSLEVVAYCHPEWEVRAVAMGRYEQLANLFHLRIETYADFHNRLGPKEWPSGQPRNFKEAAAASAPQKEDN